MVCFFVFGMVWGSTQPSLAHIGQKSAYGTKLITFILFRGLPPHDSSKGTNDVNI